MRLLISFIAVILIVFSLFGGKVLRHVGKFVAEYPNLTANSSRLISKAIEDEQRRESIQEKTLNTEEYFDRNLTNPDSIWGTNYIDSPSGKKCEVEKSSEILSMNELFDCTYTNSESLVDKSIHNKFSEVPIINSTTNHTPDNLGKILNLLSIPAAIGTGALPLMKDVQRQEIEQNTIMQHSDLDYSE